MAILDSRYTINGLVDTSRPALDNLTDIVNSCNTWLSYDAQEGKWAVVINRPGDSEFSFTDSNILGPINLTTTDLTSFYNSVEVRFHNFALRDREDYVLLEIPSNLRLPNEPDNRLIINAPLVNNQIQAQLLGLIELKQSRLDEIIEFTTDYSYVNVEAGTIISVTNSVYGWTNRLFRVLQVSEQEQDNTLLVSITAQEYDAAVYDDSDLFEYYREREDGLIELDPLVDVSPVTANTDVLDANGDSLLGLLGANLLLALLKSLMEDDDADPGSIFEQIFNIFEDETGTNIYETAKAGGVFGYDIFSASTSSIDFQAGDLINITDGQSNTVALYDKGYVTQANLLETGTFTALESGPHVVQAQFVFFYDNAQWDSTNTMLKGARLNLVTSADAAVDNLFDTIRGDSFQDIPLTFIATLVAGTSYKLKYGAFVEQLNGILGNSAFSLVVRVSRSI